LELICSGFWAAAVGWSAWALGSRCNWERLACWPGGHHPGRRMCAGLFWVLQPPSVSIWGRVCPVCAYSL